ncbi:MAG: hypothetical protein A3D65_02985 [Candidatus Lloydbacteria bacterium RIFCSPHIGHO2_02_FULL_50_13]|uniref:Uncharacterized protein n=1 Tax=Candidatus Lloydbacteria bacterium RIFCSPHIGHO2_02_FULL_50_13 TaxID=1798661 RepID=A0A1G2D550_9BACT|nr:MAG: hypothetical protein A3D65_02985 [Candidatus Lloydbacteria bacterium RIFCSPHIGHO2_02_FULL_50_13]
MKNVLLLTLLAIGLSACSDYSQKMHSVTIKEEIVEARSVTVREIMFVNNRSGDAVTRVVLNGEAPLAPASMVGYDFHGYHLDIAVGTKAVLEYLLRDNGFNQRYFHRLCVETRGDKKLCAEKD